MSITPTEGLGSSYFGTAAATSATGTTGSTTGASTSGTDQMNQDMFLKLMVAQLKNQDPMNPTDSSQFLAQTAQFTSLEKLTDVADQTTQALSAQLAFGASGLVGRSVTYTGADGAEKTGTVSTVSFTGNGPMLGIDGSDVALNSVTGVSQTSTTA
jgi:flagellar basal-body rod modification protein FlgD